MKAVDIKNVTTQRQIFCLKLKYTSSPESEHLSPLHHFTNKVK
jgi:hypothetical protein